MAYGPGLICYEPGLPKARPGRHITRSPSPSDSWVRRRGRRWGWPWHSDQHGEVTGVGLDTSISSRVPWTSTSALTVFDDKDISAAPPELSGPRDGGGLDVEGCGAAMRQTRAESGAWTVLRLRLRLVLPHHVNHCSSSSYVGES